MVNALMYDNKKIKKYNNKCNLACLRPPLLFFELRALYLLGRSLSLEPCPHPLIFLS
jgi:hypothetical protein